MNNNLPHWDKYQKILKNGESAMALGFLAQKHIDGRLTRVNARYRLAKSFDGVLLDKYSDDSVQGYSALMKVFLIYSAFEGYMELISKDTKKCKIGSEIIDANEAKRISADILELDKKKTFYKFVSSFSNKYIEEDLENFYQGKGHNLVCLLSSTRHIFVHGHLTPHANRTSPKKVIKICTLLSDFFLKQMEKDFSERFNNKIKLKGK